MQKKRYFELKRPPPCKSMEGTRAPANKHGAFGENTRRRRFKEVEYKKCQKEDKPSGRKALKVFQVAPNAIAGGRRTCCGAKKKCSKCYCLGETNLL